mgnify:CR=1 FL=1
MFDNVTGNSAGPAIPYINVLNVKSTLWFMQPLLIFESRSSFVNPYTALDVQDHLM